MSISKDEHGRLVVKRETDPGVGEHRPRLFLCRGGSMTRPMIEEDEPEMESLRLGQNFTHFHSEI